MPHRSSSDLVLRDHRRGVTTLTMCMPSRLNGWTMEMMTALREAFRRAADDDATRAVILTGRDPYYSAGVNLGGTLQLRHPRELRALIIEHNQALFDNFIGFSKPLLAAVNGPAIGASVTSAALCDAIIASDKATFSTPFAALGVPAEGCSSVMFPKLLGAETAKRMLGREGYKPTGTEAHEMGLADWVVPHHRLLEEAQRIAEDWIASGAVRRFRGGFRREELEEVNAVESVRVADAFLDAPFLRAQYRFLWRKHKRLPAAIFFALCQLRPLWARLL